MKKAYKAYPETGVQIGASQRYSLVDVERGRTVQGWCASSLLIVLITCGINPIVLFQHGCLGKRGCSVHEHEHACELVLQRFAAILQRFSIGSGNQCASEGAEVEIPVCQNPKRRKAQVCLPPMHRRRLLLECMPTATVVGALRQIHELLSLVWVMVKGALFASCNCYFDDMLLMC
jgi:hypothetical protein